MAGEEIESMAGEEIELEETAAAEDSSNSVTTGAGEEGSEAAEEGWPN